MGSRRKFGQRTAARRACPDGPRYAPLVMVAGLSYDRAAGIACMVQGRDRIVASSRRGAMTGLPPLQSLKAFEAVARLGSHAKAADELRVTESAISHQIRALEDWLGIALFTRVKRHLVLNELGRAYGDVLTGAFVDIRRQTARIQKEAQHNIVNIGAIPSFASRCLVPRLDRFVAANPLIQLRILNFVHQQPFHLGDADFAVVYGDGFFGELQSIKLVDGALYPVCHRRYLARAGPIADARSLLRCQLLHDADPDYWHKWFRAFGLDYARRSPNYVFQDFNAMYAATLAGHGVALCPINLIRDDIDEGRLHQLFDIATNEDYGYFVVFEADRASLTPARRLVLDWLLSEFPGSAAAGRA